MIVQDDISPVNYGGTPVKVKFPAVGDSGLPRGDTSDHAAQKHESSSESYQAFQKHMTLAGQSGETNIPEKPERDMGSDSSITTVVALSEAHIKKADTAPALVKPGIGRASSSHGAINTDAVETASLQLEADTSNIVENSNIAPEYFTDAEELGPLSQRGEGLITPLNATFGGRAEKTARTDSAIISTAGQNTDIDEKLAIEKLLDARQFDTLHKSTEIQHEQVRSIESALLNTTQSRPADSAIFTLGTATAVSTPAIAPGSPVAATLQGLNTPLNGPSLTSVMKSIVQTLETQKGVTVRLDPPEMGRVYIDYQFDADRSVTALVRADLPEALMQLRDNSALLQSFLKEHGFDHVNLNFEQNTSGGDTSEAEDFQERAILTEEADIKTLVPNISQLRAQSAYPTSLSIDIKL